MAAAKHNCDFKFVGADLHVANLGQKVPGKHYRCGCGAQKVDPRKVQTQSAEWVETIKPASRWRTASDKTRTRLANFRFRATVRRRVHRLKHRVETTSYALRLGDIRMVPRAWSLPSVMGAAGEIFISEAGGKWNEGTTWVGGVVPTSAEDVVALANGKSASLTVSAEASCRSLNFTNYVKTFKVENFKVNIGAGTAGPGNVALKLVSGMTFTMNQSSTSILLFNSTSATEQTIDWGGKSAAGRISFEGEGSVHKFLNPATFGELLITKGEVKTDGQTVNTGLVIMSGTSTKVFNFEKSTIKMTKGNNQAWNITATGTTIKAKESNLIFAPLLSEAAEARFGGFSYGTVTVEKGAAGGGSFVIGVTSNSFEKLDLSKAGNRVIKLVAGKVQTVTKELLTEGTSEQHVQIESATSGSQATFKIESATFATDYVTLKDLKAEGTPSAFYAGAHSTSTSGNSGWTFTPPEVAPVVTTGEAPVNISHDLQGTVDPGGAATEWKFEWGLDESYGNSTALQSAGSGHGPVAVEAKIGDLVASTLYHYRSVATNAKGTVHGPDQTFIASGGARVSVVA